MKTKIIEFLAILSIIFILAWQEPVLIPLFRNLPYVVRFGVFFVLGCAWGNIASEMLFLGIGIRRGK